MKSLDWKAENNKESGRIAQVDSEVRIQHVKAKRLSIYVMKLITEGYPLNHYLFYIYLSNQKDETNQMFEATVSR